MSIAQIITDMEKNNSLFESEIRKLDPQVCKVFKSGNEVKPVLFEKQGDTLSTKDSDAIARAFPKTVAKSRNKVLYASGTNTNPATGKRVAVLFSGGPAAGGHNVVAGLKKALGDKNTLVGVIAGPKGLLAGDMFEVKGSAIDRILNTGGFDFLGSDRTKIKTDEQFISVQNTCKEHKLDAIVVIGGDDSNTNAAVLAEYLADLNVQVIGVPKTIDGDLQVGKYLPISFGFDTATQIYSELVGNILQDTPSSRKYWHFVKLMGRSASHVALEVALQTKPAFCLISEEIAEKQMSLGQIVDDIAQVVVKRAHHGINHGVVIVPEGVVEFIPEMKVLIDELNDLMPKYDDHIVTMPASEKCKYMAGKLDGANHKLFESLPGYIQEMLLLDRDSHGNLQVSQIPTERLLIDMAKNRIKELDEKVKFSTQNHFFGYEGRCGAPTRFDAMYTYNLGLTAGSLILAGKTGYMASMTDFDEGGKILAIPLTGLINIERRHGKDEMVIEKGLVKTGSPAFVYFADRRDDWAREDCFTSPGPRQMWGPIANQISLTVALNQNYKSLNFSV